MIASHISYCRTYFRHRGYKLGYVQLTVTSALYDRSKIIIANEATSKTVRKWRNFLSATSNLHNLYLPVTLTRTLLSLDPMSFVAMHTIFSWSSPNCIELVVNVFLSSENLICMLIGWKKSRVPLLGSVKSIKNKLSRNSIYCTWFCPVLSDLERSAKRLINKSKTMFWGGLACFCLLENPMSGTY